MVSVALREGEKELNERVIYGVSLVIEITKRDSSRITRWTLMTCSSMDWIS